MQSPRWLRPCWAFTAAIVLSLVAVPSPAHAAAGIVVDAPPGVHVAAPGVVQEVDLRDGSLLVGRIESVTGDMVVVRTSAGARVEVARTDIVAVRERGASAAANAEAAFPPDPNATRLFFGPTGRSLEARHGYLGVYEVFLPFVQYAPTDWLTLGGGTPLVFGEATGDVFWFTPKVQLYRSDQTAVSAGVFHIVGIDEDDGSGSAGIAYGVATFGSPDRAVTVGVGYGYAHFEDDAGGVMAMLGGEYRIRRNVKLISENYLFEKAGLASGGVRFIGGRLAADLAVGVAFGDGEAAAFPMVNFVWSFGR